MIISKEARRPRARGSTTRRRVRKVSEGRRAQRRRAKRRPARGAEEGDAEPVQEGDEMEQNIYNKMTPEIESVRKDTWLRSKRKKKRNLTGRKCFSRYLKGKLNMWIEKMVDKQTSSKLTPEKAFPRAHERR